MTTALSSHFVGQKLKPLTRRFTWRDTMNYAAAVSDHNPLYFDDEQERGVVAPPLFSVALTWPLTSNIGAYLQDSAFPQEVLLTQVHYTEAIQFFRPLRPDATLTIKGRIDAILPHRAGTHVVLRYAAYDQQGRSLFTEHIGAMLRGVTCADEGRGRSALPNVPDPGERQAPIWEACVPLDAARPFIYDGCTNISFPIHTSRKFAHQVGLPGTILQGTATLAYAARELVNREADGDPLRLKMLSCRFTNMVPSGSDIVIQLVDRRPGAEGLETHFVVLNHAGRKAISGGYALL